MHHLTRLIGNARRDDDFARGINLNAHGFCTLVFMENAALICHREFSYVLEFIAEELDAHCVLCCGGEDVDDATAHGKLPALCHHVDALIGELDKFKTQLGQEVVFANLERQRRVVGEPGNDGLQYRANARDHIDVTSWRIGG